MKLRQAVRTVLFNQFFISLPMLLLLYPVLHRWADPCRRQLPTFQWFLLELAVFTVLEEVLFYYSHRYAYIWGKGFFGDGAVKKNSCHLRPGSSITRHSTRRSTRSTMSGQHPSVWWRSMPTPSSMW